ncbi:MAG: hypothetical protein ACK5JJ_14360 [Cyanobacteriota bacterium]
MALLVHEAVRHQTGTSFTTIQAVPYTCELTPPALQRGEPHAQQSRHLTSPCPSGHAAIDDLQGLAAIRRRVQSPASSPQ